MSCTVTTWSSSTKNTVQRAAWISSRTWFSPRLRYRPLLALRRCASSTMSVSCVSGASFTKAPEPLNRLLMRVLVKVPVRRASYTARGAAFLDT